MKGFDVDILRYINETTGANIKLITGQWPDIVQKAKTHEIDGLTVSAPLKARESDFNFSDKYASDFPLVIVSSDTPQDINQLGDLAGKTIAIQKGNGFFKVLLNPYPDIKAIAADSEIKAIAMVVNGKADAAFCSTSTYNIIQKKFLKTIKIALIIEDRPLNVVYSIRKDWPALITILNKALASLPPETENRIYSRWFGFSPAELDLSKGEERISLTAQEQEWIKEHPEIRFGAAPEWQPFDFIDEMGQHQGIASDYIKFLNKRLGINMKILPNMSWRQLMEAIPQRGVDTLSSVVKMPGREKYLSFTDPYLYIDWVIIHPIDAPKISNIADFEGRNIAVFARSAIQSTLEKQYPGINLLPEKTTLDVLQSVIVGKAEAAVVERITANMTMNAYRMHSLEVDQLVFSNDRPLSLAVRNDWPELVQILNKGLASITPKERAAIEQKWMAVPIQIGFTRKDMLRIVLYVITGMGILLVLSLFWNRRLKKEINERVKAEKERKRSEDALVQSQTRQRTLVDALPDLVWLKDQDGVYLSCNQMFERFFGAKESEIVGKTDYDFIDKDLADFFRTNDRKAMVADRPSINEEELTFADNGYSGLFETIKTPIRDSNGNLISVLGIARDVSERERIAKEKLLLERQLKQSQKMESIGNLAGGIAHDFNNILSSVIGFTELALDEVEKESTKDSLHEVYAAGKRAKNLVKQILAFARQSDEEIKPVQVGSIAKEVMKFIRSSIPTTIEIKGDVDSDSMVMGNSTQIHQVFMNLCTNAAHAMENQGGILYLQVQDIVVENRSNPENIYLKLGKYVEIKVSDSGVGIEPEILAAIFEPYFTTKGVGEGTGMGLAMVKGIIESYGGQISVNSQLGKGTTFTIYLPASGKYKTDEPYQTGMLPSGTERILFVDDEVPIAKMGSQILERLGYSVTPKTSSMEALDLFRSRPIDFDLIITDMTMPNMTGDKLSVELMKIRADIPIILCTGYSKKISKETADHIGIKAFAAKPIIKADLAKTVRMVLDEAKKKIQQ